MAKKTELALILDPELKPYSGRQYPIGKNIFGLFADASPDRWGRVLMNKRERILTEKEGRKPSKLHDSDYLMGVYDETRMGGIRFKLAVPEYVPLTPALALFEPDEQPTHSRQLNKGIIKLLFFIFPSTICQYYIKYIEYCIQYLFLCYFLIFIVYNRSI